jgi:hypothetical protein
MLKNEKLSDLYRSLNIVKEVKTSRLRSARNAVRTWETRNEYRILVKELLGKRAIVRLRRIW